MAANLSGSFGSCEFFRDFLFSSHENLTLFACGKRWRGTSDDNDEEIKMRNWLLRARTSSRGVCVGRLRKAKEKDENETKKNG